MEKVSRARQTGAIVGSETYLKEPKAGRRKENPSNWLHERKNVSFAVILPCLWLFLFFYGIFCYFRLRMLMFGTSVLLCLVVQQQCWELDSRTDKAGADNFTPVVFVWFSFTANLEVLRIILVKLLYLWIHPLCYYGLKCLISDAYPALRAREEKSRK